MTIESALGRGSASPRRTRRVSVVGVIGELFITAGVIVMLFLGWQLWLDNLIVSNEQTAEAQEQSLQWNKGESTAPAPENRPDPGEPVVAGAPGNAVRFAVLIIPRLGADWAKPVGEGVGTKDVLNLGIGHYPGTAMPGAVGNAAFAGHRTGYGSPLFDIVSLQVGDSMYIETEAGWYLYVYRSMEYVLPDGVSVLEPVPQFPGASPADRILTLTSCNPAYSASERVIAYAVYETWYPRAGGPPAEIAATVTASAAG